MNLLLEKVLLFKKTSPRYLVAFSFFLLSGSMILPFNLWLDHQEKTLRLNAYIKQIKTVAKLQKAHERFNHAMKDATPFIEAYLETSHLLKNYSLRSLQIDASSIPLNLNPHENVLKHKKQTLFKNGRSTDFFTLKKSVFVDEEDLKELFALVDQRTIFPFEKIKDSPLLFFSHFSIEKHFLPSCEKVYQISYTLEAPHSL